MNRSAPGRDPSYFDALYAADPDPWRFESSGYERNKYRATLASLPHRRWRRGFEAGCSIGILTRLLATRCDHLLAIDCAAYAVRTAATSCAGLSNLEVRQAAIPETWAGPGIGLIVLSEVLYFLSASQIVRCAALARQTLARDGLIVLVNWRGSTETPLSGDAAATLFIQNLGHGWRQDVPTPDPRYRLDLLSRPVAVAQ